MASHLEAGAAALNDDGLSGYIANAGSLPKDVIGRADYVGSKTITIDTSHPKFGNDRDTQFTAGHESLHSAGLDDQIYAGHTAYRYSRDFGERHAFEKLPKERRWKNPDHIMSIVFQ